MRVTRITIVLLLLTATFNLSAQSTGSTYKTALGVKFGDGGAITLKHFVKPDAALEGLAYFWRYGTSFTGLYEFHGNITGAPGLKWYAGPGAHIGFWNSRWQDRYGTTYSGTYAGVDGVLGLDYKFTGAPINLSLDWQPSFNFGNGPDRYYGFYAGWGGFSIRYTF
ncbi:MAG TPA: hypothetical protein VFN30_08730 [Chitinophagaceae bacterium]|nr:hypothetical protein [Chitinophagaceae bacterium]